MWDEEEIVNYLRNNLKEKRFLHSLGVRESAVNLAEFYNADISKASTAALVHDCAKYMRRIEILKILEEKEIVIDDVTREYPDIMHGAASAYIAEKVMGIYDNEILDAVRYHTTGRKDMTLLEKIIYIADYIEPNRNFPGVDELRKISFVDIDKALLKAFNNTIKYVIDNGQLIHLKTIEARNYLISEIER